MGKFEKEKKPFLKRLGTAVLEFLGELVAMAVFFAIGAGIMSMLGNRDALETMDPDLPILLGSLVVLAAFGILFAIIAAIRKKNKE